MSKRVSGFSKLSKEEKVAWLTQTFFKDQNKATQTLTQYWNNDQDLQTLHDDFIENTISNFYLPYGIAPNFEINGKTYAIPMVIEESSVVAAASKMAKFWSKRGGFHAEIIGTQKIGHVHFHYEGLFKDLKTYFEKIKPELFEKTAAITANMKKRGGGISDIQLIDKTNDLDGYYQLKVTFETKDSMGANFINSCLEAIAQHFRKADIHVIMSILSNYVPECKVKAWVSCPIEDLVDKDVDESPLVYANKFKRAVDIAHVEPYRAVTHNKGIMNGVDAVVLATANDFRAIEACVHAYAAKDGAYKSLSHCEVKEGQFTFWIEMPLALGTVGGLTKLHPLAKFSLDLLERPSAPELMQIIAVAGLAQNFAALRALTTSGIQKGHMKMHLMNIINQLGADEQEKSALVKSFEDQPVSFSAVEEALATMRK